MGDNMTNKSDLRKSMINQLKENRLKYNNELKIYKTLFEQSTFKEAKTIAITLSMAHEINTKFIIKYAQMLGKQIYIPNCDYKSKVMNFQLFTNFDDLVIDNYGIEAMGFETEINNEIDLVITPGVVFNLNCYRIGYGGGYYDRFLSNYNGETISLAHEIQIQEFDHDSYDEPVHKIITEKRIINGVRND